MSAATSPSKSQRQALTRKSQEVANARATGSLKKTGVSISRKKHEVPVKQSQAHNSAIKNGSVAKLPLKAKKRKLSRKITKAGPAAATAPAVASVTVSNITRSGRKHKVVKAKSISGNALGRNTEATEQDQTHKGCLCGSQDGGSNTVNCDICNSWIHNVCAG